MCIGLWVLALFQFFVQVSLPFDKLEGFWTLEQFFGCNIGRRFLRIQPFDDIFLESETQPHRVS